MAIVAGLAGVPVANGSVAARGPGAPQQLTVDGLSTALGIDDTPQFAWQVDDSRRGALQSAYRVLVATAPTTSPTDASVQWDSGAVSSSRQAFVSYAGPPLRSDAAYWWTVQTADGSGATGPFAAPQQFETGLQDADWKANWIRRTSSDEVDKADDYTYARKEVTLAASPIVRACAYVSADHQYQLWINGAMVDRGEAFSYPDSQYYQASDVTAALQAGSANAVGLLYHWYGVGKGRPEGQSGVIAQLSVEHADGTSELIVTDGTWRVTRAEWLPGTQRNTELDPVHYTEHINGPNYPVGWSEPGFNDLLWQPAVALGQHPVEPWTHLGSVRTHIVETPVTAVSVTQLASGAVVADFGAVVAAVPTVSFRHGVAGRAITMHAGYLLDEPTPGQPFVGEPGQVSTKQGTQHTDMSYAYVERADAQTFRPFDYLGFRYLQIDNPGETLGSDQIVAYARHSSEPELPPATFSSSNPTVDAVFALAEHSALFGSQEQFIDTPTREKSPFLRDGFNISETAMRAFGEQNLTRRALLEFAQSQARYWPDGHLNAIYPSGQGKRDIPDFTEIYPEWAWQYYLNTGDEDLLSQVYPVLTAIADYVATYVDAGTGLVTNLAGGDGQYLYGIVDWPPNMRYGYDMSTVVRTTVNMLAVDVFDRVARVALALGRPPAEIDQQQGRRDALVSAINSRLARDDGTYADGLVGDGGQSGHSSQHANAYALAYDIAPQSATNAVADAVVAQGMAMGPQTVQELLAALHRSGRDAELVALLTDPNHDGWANVLARGGTFTWETWQPSDANGDSMSHGWGSTVLVNIDEALLGVTPTAPGFEQVDVRPLNGGLDHAEGTVPTGRGPIAVAWSRSPDVAGPFELTVALPANVSGTVGIPAGGPDSITEDGQSLRAVAGVQFLRMEGDLAILAVGSGSYVFRSGPVPARYAGHVSGIGPGSAGPTSTASSNQRAGASGCCRASGAGVTGTSHGDHRAPWWLIVVLLASQLTLMTLAVRAHRRSLA